MKGNEKQVLNIIAELNQAESTTIAKILCVSPEFINEICKDLVNSGYLLDNGSGNYKLTSFARKKLDPVRTRGPIPILKGGG